MTDPLHLSTPAGNPACKAKDPAARLTGNPNLVTCEDCQPRAMVIAERRGGLLPLDQARQLLAQCMRVDEAKDIRDKAQAIGAYLRQQKASGAAQNDAAEIKLRAERRLGELLEPDQEKRGGAKSQRATLPEGISRSQSARWQDIARVPEEKFEAFIAQTRESGGEVTTSGLRREHVSEVKRQARVEKLAEIARGNKPLPVGASADRYPVIYADPPWEYDRSSATPNRQIENQYPTMDLDAVCALPVARLATDDAILFLWVPAPKLAEGMLVITAWGFTYRTGRVWVKPSIGPGYWVRQRHEHLLIATRGDFPTPPPDARPDSVQESPRGEHSEKPAIFAVQIEAMYPELPRIELFARKEREFWARWGNQAPGALGAIG